VFYGVVGVTPPPLDTLRKPRMTPEGVGNNGQGVTPPPIA